MKEARRSTSFLATSFSYHVMYATTKRKKLLNFYSNINIKQMVMSLRLPRTSVKGRPKNKTLKDKSIDIFYYGDH